MDQSRTTNIEAMFIALAGVLGGLAVLFTLGWWRPSWAFRAANWVMRRKFPDEPGV